MPPVRDVMVLLAAPRFVIFEAWEFLLPSSSHGYPAFETHEGWGSQCRAETPETFPKRP